MSSAPDDFSNKVLRQVVTLLCCNMGWDAAQSSALDILSDIMRRHFLHLAKSTKSYAEEYGRTLPNFDDVALAMRDMNISVGELEEYVQNFDPITLPQKIP